jgi:hypothetical protein
VEPKESNPAARDGPEDKQAAALHRNAVGLV